MERALLLRRPREDLLAIADGLPSPLRESLVSYASGDFLESLRLLPDSDTSPSVSALRLSSSLSLFLSLNWTGPSDTVSATETDLSPLSVDGETPSPLIKSPRLLVDAIRCLPLLAEDGLRPLWSSRLSMTHQRIMRNPCDSLRRRVVSDLSAAIAGLSEDREALFGARMELAICHLFYRERSKCRKVLEAVCADMGLEVRLTGAMGKRTKYQDKPTAQMYLEVVRHAERRSPPPQRHRLRESATLEGDSDLLEVLQFEGSVDGSVLRPREQCVVLALALDHQARQATQDTIKKEEILAYANRVLRDHWDWSVENAALLHRCRLEGGSLKTACRALTQMEILVHDYSPSVKPGEEEPVPVLDRLASQHLVLYPRIDELKRELGTLMVSMGQAGAALKLFEETGMWEDVIRCHMALGDRAKAEDVARRRLEVAGPVQVPDLLCTLGDVTGGAEHYEKAWELSGRRLARAKRSMGHLCFKAAKYAECVVHYEQALAVNPLFERCWFALGCASMKLEAWQKALGAFCRVVSIDPEDGEAWCNIAAVHMQCGRAAEAHTSLQEALRHKPDDWKVWQNRVLVAVSPAVRDYRAALFGLTRLLDLCAEHHGTERAPPSSCMDPRSFYALVSAVTSDAKTCQGDGASALREQLEALLYRAERECDMSVALWDIFAVFSEACGDVPKWRDRRSAQCRAVEGERWPTDPKLWPAVCDAYCDLSRAFACSDQQSRDPVIARIRSVLHRATPVHSSTKDFALLSECLQTLISSS